MRDRIPNALSWLRIGLLPVLYFLAWRRALLAFTILYLIEGLTDVLDGFLARRWKVDDARGCLLDSSADTLFYLSIIPWLYLFVPEAFLSHTRLITGIVGAYALIAAFAFMKYGQLISYHTYMSKTAGITLFLFGFVSIVFGHVPWVVYAAAAIFALYCLEALALTIMNPRPVHDIRSVFHCRRR